MDINRYKRYRDINAVSTVDDIIDYYFELELTLSDTKSENKWKDVHK